MASHVFQETAWTMLLVRNRRESASGLSDGGTIVTVTGINFTGVIAVTFDTTATASFTYHSASSITATTPVESGTAIGASHRIAPS